MVETKKINWAERLARLRQRRNPGGLDEKKLGIKQYEDMSGGTSAEQVMAPLSRLDQWTMNAVRQFAAHHVQLENPGVGQIDQTDINQWLYDFLQVHSFDDLMGEIKQATAGYFENFDPEAPLETYEFMGHTIELHHSAEGTGEANQYYAYIDGEYDDKTLADTPAQAKGNAEAVCHMLPRRGPVTFSPGGPVRHCGIVGQAEALVKEVLKRARGV